jgi:hypothetical protein
VCPYNNLRFSTRGPFADFFGATELRRAQAGFIFLVSGFVIYEILSEWPVSKTILTWVPYRLVDAVQVTGPTASFVSAIVMFIMFPVALLLAVVALAKIRPGIPSGAITKTFALLLLPTMVAAHFIKAILKMTSRIPYWPYVFSDAAGIDTARKILDKRLVLDQSILISLQGVTTLAMAALLLIALVATPLILCKSPAVKELNATAKVALLLGTLTYWSIFGIMIFKWRF